MIHDQHLHGAIAQMTNDKLKGHQQRLSAILWLIIFRPAKSQFDAILLARCGFIQHHRDLHPCLTHYHETKTCFWAQQVWDFFVENQTITAKNKNLKRTHEELEELILKSPLANQNLIYDFYTTDCLKSLEAKAVYLPPNKKIVLN